jgi:hypothetical protein
LRQKNIMNIAVFALIISVLAIVLSGFVLNRLRTPVSDVDDLERKIDSLERDIAVAQAKVRLISLRAGIQANDDFERLADEADNIRLEFLDSFNDDVAPLRLEDINSTFIDLERLIREDEEGAISLIDALVSRLNIQIDTTPFEACTDAGGEWREFPTACADKCYQEEVCAQVLTFSCDCGPNMCWNGLTCQPLIGGE